MVIMVTASSFPLPDAVLRMQLSVSPLGILFTAPTSGLSGLSLPGLTLLAAWGQKGMVGALTACDQVLPQLKVDRPD